MIAAFWLGPANAEEAVLAHPPFKSFYSCAEHGAGQLPALGDDRGTDCFVQKLVESGGRTWLRAHAGDGLNNEDWFGWNQSVLSPCDCTVLKRQENPTTNVPGILGAPPAAYLVLKRADGIHFMIAHVQAVSVREGQRVKYGQELAKVGNNGYSRQPHIHIGAWKGEAPVQIRFDQRFMQGPQLHAGVQPGIPADGSRPAGEPRR